MIVSWASNISIQKNYQSMNQMNTQNLVQLKKLDLEGIKSADPDLIIINGRQADFYDQLSAIAPTISVSKDNADYVGSVKENVNTIAELFEVEEKASEELKKSRS